MYYRWTLSYLWFFLSISVCSYSAPTLETALRNSGVAGGLSFTWAVETGVLLQV